ncbi:hypothetical protein Metvu_0251 [Methanocaldococcus vulcanius M7]|uniref:Uncharacterized protein n=1 Tax=Methanocaldococcus vulcanius (strain ATCC 700851 / DSM 12094 / M7) TaxID=579137 RepID=C9REW6_METVM|nr:hypothetical protein [Methanocaldococcus vulcanius]ACX72118.1 hypothetical protein Metvu_0251 [Methanocaldococcus vulcanius M7]
MAKCYVKITTFNYEKERKYIVKIVPLREEMIVDKVRRVRFGVMCSSITHKVSISKILSV